MKKLMTSYMHGLQFSDSALPVGAFSFSNGVETAVHEGAIQRAEDLESFVRTALRQMATVDGIAALHAFRLMKETPHALQPLMALDRELLAMKLNEESRIMSLRMGKKLIQLGKRLFDCELLHRWDEEVTLQGTPGNYALVQGVLFALSGNPEEELFGSLCFGLINQMTGAALRCMKISHFETQLLLFHLCEEVESLYESVQQLTPEEMHAFAPEMDLWASLHEKGPLRMFMN